MLKRNKKYLSIIIPILNEAKNINYLVPKISKVIKKNYKNYELIIIDDNSEDNIYDVINKLKNKFKFLKFIQRKNKSERDLTKSCLEALKICNSENILIMDGDLQHNPDDIKKLYEELLISKSDIVIGTRNFTKKKNGLSLIRCLSSIMIIFLFNFFLSKNTKKKISDPMSGFFIFKKNIINRIKKRMYGKGFKILSDIIYTKGTNLKINEISIKFNYRIRGKSKMNLSTVYHIIGLFFNKL
jgi:dolichol-phosphate mannosyltransferase